MQSEISMWYFPRKRKIENARKDQLIRALNEDADEKLKRYNESIDEFNSAFENPGVAEFLYWARGGRKPRG